MTEEKQNKKSHKVNFWLGIFVGMAAISVIGFFTLLAIVFSQNQPINLGVNADEGTENAGQEKVVLEDIPEISNEDYYLGGKNAKVEVIEYSDFECPFCARHYGTSSQLVKEYGNKIKFVFRHYPLSFHQNAMFSAEAAECAGDQGKFWQMHDKLFDLNLEKDFSQDSIKAAAKKLGLNSSKFTKCLEDNKYQDKVKDQMAAANAAGVTGTPATFINGELISGARAIEDFRAAIDAALGK